VSLPLWRRLVGEDVTVGLERTMGPRMSSPPPASRFPNGCQRPQATRPAGLSQSRATSRPPATSPSDDRRQCATRRQNSSRGAEKRYRHCTPRLRHSSSGQSRDHHRELIRCFGDRDPRHAHQCQGVYWCSTKSMRMTCTIYRWLAKVSSCRDSLRSENVPNSC